MAPRMSPVCPPILRFAIAAMQNAAAKPIASASSPSGPVRVRASTTATIKATMADNHGGRPTPCDSPSVRAGGTAAITSPIMDRDPHAARRIAEVPARASPCQRRPITTIKAKTPYAPLRLSFMIWRRRAWSCPPQSPSAASASPSSCIAPVIRTKTASVRPAEMPSPKFALSRPTQAASPPTRRPTKG